MTTRKSHSHVSCRNDLSSVTFPTRKDHFRSDISAITMSLMPLDAVFIQVGFHHFLQSTQALGVSRGIALLFSRTFGTRWGWGVSPTPRPPQPPGKTQYPLCRRLGGPQGRSGRAKNLVPTGIRSRTVQPVAQSLYLLSYRAHPFLFILSQFNHWDVLLTIA